MTECNDIKHFPRISRISGFELLVHREIACAMQSIHPTKIIKYFFKIKIIPMGKLINFFQIKCLFIYSRMK